MEKCSTGEISDGGGGLVDSPVVEGWDIEGSQKIRQKLGRNAQLRLTDPMKQVREILHHQQ